MGIPGLISGPGTRYTLNTRVVENMSIDKLPDGAYQMVYTNGDAREYKTGTLDELIDALKVLVVTARIES